MKYSIKDLAEILGCTTSAIHYFEKEDLIHVQKGENGHRSYSVVDVFRLLSYTKYRAMEIPMKTIIKQFGGDEADYNIIERREQFYKEKALEKARYYEGLAEAIEEHLVSIRKIDSLLDKYEFAQSPERIAMSCGECGWISKYRDSQKKIQKWVEAMPHVQLAVLNSRDSLSDFGYIVSQKKAEELNLPQELNCILLEQTSCIHTIVIADEDFADNPQKVFEKAVSYARARNLEVGDNFWGKILLAEVEKESKLNTYVELWIPVK